MRHKEVHAINTHPSVKFALDFGLSLISEKIRKRVKIYTSLNEAINRKMDASLLPKEYGGTMPMKEMIGKSRGRSFLSCPASRRMISRKHWCWSLKGKPLEE